MDNAYDKVLQTVVSANDAVANRGFEPYRFECLYCGEEVRIAAPFSTQRSPHFRHLHGNNDIECEEYLGLGLDALCEHRRRKGNKEVADIIFNSSTKTFSIQIKFTEDEIELYEKENVCLEIRENGRREAFKRIAINHTNFISDVFTPFFLDKFSDKYYVAIGDNREHVYDFMAVDNLSFFKLHGDEKDYRAKQLRSFADTPVLYTQTRYIAVALNPSLINELYVLSDNVVEKRFEFETMGRLHFYAAEIYIDEKTPIVENYLESMGYRIEENDTFTVLWPPYKTCDDKSLCEGENIYVYSSFEMKPHCGNNIGIDGIEKLGNGISRIRIDDCMRVYRKNTELQLFKYRPNREYEEVVPTIINLDKYVIPEEGIAFLFDEDKILYLPPSRKIYLSGDQKVKRIKNNRVIEIIEPKYRKSLSFEEIAQEAELYYKVETSYDINAMSKDISDCELKYLEEHVGNCNAAVLRIIEKRRI